VLAWSLQFLAAGVYPSVDPWGRCFDASYEPCRAALAGQFLANGWRGVLAGHRGDAVYMRKVYGFLECWTSIFMCFLCCAQARKCIEGMLYSDSRRDADHRYTPVPWMRMACQALTMQLHHTSQSRPCTQRSPLKQPLKQLMTMCVIAGIRMAFGLARDARNPNLKPNNSAIL
jgi:hypothetical protein